MVPQTSFLETVGIFANARGSTENFCTLTRPAFTTSGGGGNFLELVTLVSSHEACASSEDSGRRYIDPRNLCKMSKVETRHQ